MKRYSYKATKEDSSNDEKNGMVKSFISYKINS